MRNNSDKFDYLIALAATKCLDEEARDFNDLDTSKVVFDDSYYRKKKQTIRQFKRRPTVKLIKNIAIRAIAAVMIIATLACVLIGCVPELRKAIYDAIVEWYDDHFAVRYENGGQEKETGYEKESANGTESEADVPTYIEEIRKPTNLPEGVWEDIVLENKTQTATDYYDGDIYLFSFIQIVLKPNEKYVDNESVEVSHTIINGHDTTIVERTNNTEIDIFWNDGEYSYHMFSTECDLETLLKYAESVE